MIELIPMTEVEFKEYDRVAAEQYVHDLTRWGEIPAEEAKERAQKQWAAFLPEGLKTPEQFFYAINDKITQRRVGFLWVNIRTKTKTAFIYNINLDPEFRGKGLGKAAMDELHKTLKNQGIQSVGLHVFAPNTAAVKLYEKLGYHTTSLNMNKKL